MKFIHTESKNVIEVTDPNLFSMLKREGYEPEGGWDEVDKQSKGKKGK